MQSYLTHRSNGTHLDGIFMSSRTGRQISRPLNTSMRRLHPEASHVSQRAVFINAFKRSKHRLAMFVSGLTFTLPNFTHQSRYVYTIDHGIKPITRQRLLLNRFVPLVVVIGFIIGGSNYAGRNGNQPVTQPVVAPVVQPITSDPMAIITGDKAANDSAVVTTPSWAATWRPTNQAASSNTVAAEPSATEGGRGGDESSSQPNATPTTPVATLPDTTTETPAVTEVTTPAVTIPIVNTEPIIPPITISL